MGETRVQNISFDGGTKLLKVVLGFIPSVLLKVHKIENFFGSEFEFYAISLLVMLKY